jgi:membrane protease YdiL (CAAX protease family)
MVAAACLGGLVLAALVLFRIGSPMFVLAVGGSVRADLAEGLFKILYWAAPVLIAARFAASDWTSALARLGLTRAFFTGGLLAFLATLPMLLSMLDGVRQAIASMLAFDGHLPRFDSYSILGTAVLGPFAEEILFRGLLVGHLVTVARWRPAQAVILSAVLFTLAHTIGGIDLPMLVSVLAGGLVFGWLFVRWQSVWPAVHLHAMINFYWDVSPTTIGIWHAVALALAVGMTMRVTGTGRAGVESAGRAGGRAREGPEWRALEGPGGRAREGQGWRAPAGRE